MLVCVCVHVHVLGETLMSWEQTVTLVRVNIPKSTLRATGLFSHWHNIILLFFTSSGELVHTHTFSLSHQACLWVWLHRERSGCPAHLRAHQVQCPGALCLFVFGQCCVFFGTAHFLCLTVSFCFCFLFYSFCYCVKKRDSVCLGVPCG